MNEFRISEATQVLWEIDDDGSSVYVITKQPKGFAMATDVPTQLNGDWLTEAQRKQLAKDKIRNAKLLTWERG